MFWDQWTTLLFSELWMAHRFKSPVGLKDPMVPFLNQSVKVHIPSGYNADNDSSSWAVYDIPQMCLLSVLNHVAWSYMKWHPYLWRTHLCQTCWSSSCKEKGLCLPSPGIYIVAVGCCWTWRDAAWMPHLLSGLWWFTPENPMDLRSAGQRCLYCPFCRTASFCFQKNS